MVFEHPSDTIQILKMGGPVVLLTNIVDNLFEGLINVIERFELFSLNILGIFIIDYAWLVLRRLFCEGF
jgi:hypothetical protein